MSFFNSKEEVLDIQLTQYGKLLYSKGKFKPHYYAFFDDDILYDSEYAGYSESQNQVETRIQEQTPYIKTIGSFIGCETNIKNLDPELYNQKNLLNYTNLLGTSDLDYNFTPAWDIQLIKGNITNFSQYFTASNGQIVNIPQISTNVVYETSVLQQEINLEELSMVDPRRSISQEDLTIIEMQRGMVDDNEFNIDAIITKKRLENNYNNFNISKTFEDGSALLVEEKSVLIDVSELNTQLINDMFEIEVFKYESDTEGNEILKRLFFKNNKSNVINNILVDEEPFDNSMPNKNNVEYYFNIFTDNEIDNQTICDFITPTQKSRNTMVSIVSCDDNKQKSLTNSLYNTNVTLNGDKC